MGTRRAARNFVSPTLAENAACLVVSGVLVFAGIDKALHFDKFVLALAGYPFVSLEAARLLALPVVALELACGLGLWILPWRRVAASACAALMTIFTSALLLQLRPDVDCGCWFSVTIGSTKEHILINLILIALALTVAVDSGRIRKWIVSGSTSWRNRLVPPRT